MPCTFILPIQNVGSFYENNSLGWYTSIRLQSMEMNLRFRCWNLNGLKFQEIIQGREHSTKEALYFEYEYIQSLKYK